MSRLEQRRLRRTRRRRLVAATLTVLVVIGLGVAAVALVGAGTDDPQSAPPAVTSPTPTVTAIPSTTTAAPAPTTTTAARPTALPIDRTYAVGTHHVTYVDTSRTTSPNGDFGGAASRTLPTAFWYPAAGNPGGDAQPDAPPDRDHGKFPLVLFAHGYAVTPTFYEPMLEAWAAAGYVVAAPTFPILSGTPGGASHVDYEKTFADASFVITSILGSASSDPIAAIVDPARIAAAGHSDGEVVAFGIGFLACCRDQRVSAVIPMAGDLANAQNPHVRDTGTPILHIMETNDEYDPYQHSIDWDRDNLTSPRWMLTLVNASHVPPYTRPGNPYFELVIATTVDFLDGTLKGHPDRLDRVAADVAGSGGLGTLER
jgi:dienelactone hydrolase